MSLVLFYIFEKYQHMSIFQKVNQLILNLKNNPVIGSFFVFIFVFLTYSSIYLSNRGVSFIDDHFFHIKYAYLIRTEGFDVVQNFRWISAGPEGRVVNYQLTLYNLALIPFTYIKDLIIALKISDIFFASLSISLVFYSFKKFRLNGAIFWIIILMSFEYFFSRMLIGRALVLLPGFLMLELLFAYEKKKFNFFITSLLHVLWHNATFFMPVVIAIVVEIARILNAKKPFWQTFFYSLLASFVGLALTFNNISSMWNELYGIFLTTKNTNLKFHFEGSELYPVDVFKIIGSGNILFAFLLVSYAAVFYYYIKSKKTNFDRDNVLLYLSFLFSLVFFAGSVIVSGRFYDFYFLSTVFLVAIIFSNIIKDRIVIFSADCKRYFMISIAIFFLLLFLNSFFNEKQFIGNTDYRPIGGVAEWINKKSSVNERIFLYDWSYFPVSFFYNDKNIYNIGLEPRSSMNRPDLYWKSYNMYFYGIYCEREDDCSYESEIYEQQLSDSSDELRDILRKQNSLKVIDSIRNDFGARFVIANKDFGNLLKLNPERIIDSIEVRSGYSNNNVFGFELIK